MKGYINNKLGEIQIEMCIRDSFLTVPGVEGRLHIGRDGLSIFHSPWCYGQQHVRQFTGRED